MTNPTPTESPRAVHASEYGSLEVGRYQQPWRRDVYVSNTTGQRLDEPAMAAGPDDVSPRQGKMTYGPLAGYDARCGCCYLNITHTVELHQRRIAESEAA